MKASTALSRFWCCKSIWRWENHLCSGFVNHRILNANACDDFIHLYADHTKSLPGKAPMTLEFFGFESLCLSNYSNDFVDYLERNLMEKNCRTWWHTNGLIYKNMWSSQTVCKIQEYLRKSRLRETLEFWVMFYLEAVILQVLPTRDW